MAPGALSALYSGHVVHRRLRPHVHHFRYRVFYLLLDLDEVVALGRRGRLFGYNRRALLSFYEADHGAGDGRNLKAWLREFAHRHGIEAERFQMLCLPRVLGYVFNPISVIYCRNADGALSGIIYEVNNTFGERTWYAFPVPVATAADSMHFHACDKRMYVSPFFDVEGDYRFRVTPTDDSLALAIRYADVNGPALFTVFTGRREAFTTGALARQVARLPFMTCKVMAGIHWEAFRLWLKGVPLVKRKMEKSREAVQ